MGAKYIASLPSAGRGGGVNVPGFQSFADDLTNVTRASAVSWFTIVPDAQRAAFEAAALSVARSVNASSAPALARLARQVQAYGIRAPLGADADGAPANFQRAPQSDTYIAGAPVASVRACCIRCDARCGCASACAAVSYAPVISHRRSQTAWATAPRTNPRVLDYFLFDALSDPLRAAALRRAMGTDLPAMTDLTSWTFADDAGVVIPSAVVYAPAWVYANDTYGVGVAPGPANASDAAASLDNNPGAAFCAVAFHWAAVRLYTRAHAARRC